MNTLGQKFLFLLKETNNNDINLLETGMFSIKKITSNNFLDSINEFINSEFDHLIFLNPSRWINHFEMIESFILAGSKFIETSDHYAMCQPSIVYGKMLNESTMEMPNNKPYTHINSIDDAFLLIKGNIIRNFSLEHYIQGEEIDWYRYFSDLNQYGYQCSRLSNYFLETVPSKNHTNEFDAPIDSIDLINSSLLKKTFDVGIDFSYLDPIYNGTSEYATSLLPGLIDELKQKKYSFHIIASKQIQDMFHLEAFKEFIVDTEDESYFYKLLFIPQQIYSGKAMLRINRICFKYIFTMLDAISLRCRYIGGIAETDVASSIAYKYADSIIGLSISSAIDIEMYFAERMINRNVKPILLTKENINFSSSERVIREGYILMIGNSFKHKAIEKALLELIDTNYKIVVIGFQTKNIELVNRFSFYKSGELSEEFIQNLYTYTDLIIYPSLYEGFGLPVVAAIQMGKKILVYNSMINQELKKEFDKNNSIFFFSKFSELSKLIKQSLEEDNATMNALKEINRNWFTVGYETASLISQCLEAPINFNRINERIYECVTLKVLQRGETILALRKTIHILSNSFALKIGLFITSPLRMFKSLFNKE